MHRDVAPRAGGDSRRAVALAVGAGALALGVRLLYLASIHRALFFTHLQTEPARYAAWAEAIARGLAPFRPPLDEAPAYPYLLALLRRAFGPAPLVVAIAQALLDALSAGLLADFTRRAVGFRAGLLAGALFGLFAPAIYFTGQLEPATLGLFAVTLAIWATPLDSASPARWRWAGLAWALAVLTRAELALGAPVVIAWAALRSGRRAALSAALAPAALLLLSLSVNLASSGRPVLLTTGSGENLWIGNDALADGVNPFVDGDRLPAAHEVELQARDAIQADALFRARALGFVRGQPAQAARLALRKLVWLWSDRELPNAADIEWQTGQSWLFHRPLFPLGLGLLLPLALAGLVLAGSDLRRLGVLAAPVLIALAVAVVFFTNARFRLVMAPALCVLGALALDRAGSLRGRVLPASRKLGVGAALVAGVLLAWNDFDGVRSYRIPEIDMNTAALELTAGQTDSGLARLGRAVRARPHDAEGWLQLVGSLEQLGRAEEERAVWSEARNALPDDPRLAAGQAWFERRHPASATR